jgi:fluoroquinolone transport system permease protein
MNLTTILTTLAPIDLKNMRRDPMLIWLPIIPLAPVLIIRFGLPTLNSWLLAEFQFDLAPYTLLIVSFLTMLVPSFAGMVAGFILIDERDEHTLNALLVTPLPLPVYMFYRIAMPTFMGFVMSLVILPLSGLLALPWLPLLAVVFLAALIAPIIALALAAFAENKVVGFALLKTANALLVLPAVAYFLPEPWQWLLGVFPTFWPMKAYWLAAAASPFFWPAVSLGMVVNGLMIWGLWRRFTAVVHR